MSLWSRIANVFRGDRLSREIDEEFQSHLDEAIEQGRDPAEARRAFGSALRLREESRDVRLIAWLDSLRADAIFGWRQMKKNKVTSAAAILSLALGIGACTGAFRLIDALLLRPLPVAQSRRSSTRWLASSPGRMANPNLRLLGVSGVPADARRGEGSSRVDRHLAMPTAPISPTDPTRSWKKPTGNMFRDGCSVRSGCGPLWGGYSPKATM